MGERVSGQSDKGGFYEGARRFNRGDLLITIYYVVITVNTSVTVPPYKSDICLGVRYGSSKLVVASSLVQT